MASRKRASSPAQPKSTPSAAAGAGQSDSALSLDAVRELVNLVHEKGFEEFELEEAGLRLRIVASRPAAAPVITYAAPQMAMQHAAPMPAPAAGAAPMPAVAGASSATPMAADEDSKYRKITSPMVGTFYRSPSPGSRPFAEVGDRVQDTSVLCIIEAMKLMNEIKAECRGTIKKVLVENGQPVEYGQALFLIDPA